MFLHPWEKPGKNSKNDSTPRLLTLFYIQDHSTHGTGITNENELSESCWSKMAFNTVFQLNSGDIINFGYSHSEGLIADIDILSDYKQKRHFNIKEKEMVIPKKTELKIA